MDGTLWQSAGPGADQEPPELNPTVPHIARIYGYWLGGCFR